MPKSLFVLILVVFFANVPAYPQSSNRQHVGSSGK
jgi:hypothetical protein